MLQSVYVYITSVDSTLIHFWNAAALAASAATNILFLLESRFSPHNFRRPFQLRASNIKKMFADSAEIAGNRLHIFNIYSNHGWMSCVCAFFARCAHTNHNHNYYFFSLSCFDLFFLLNIFNLYRAICSIDCNQHHYHDQVTIHWLHRPSANVHRLKFIIMMITLNYPSLIYIVPYN